MKRRGIEMGRDSDRKKWEENEKDKKIIIK
jgi:hypothetical protein